MSTTTTRLPLATADGDEGLLRCYGGRRVGKRAMKQQALKRDNWSCCNCGAPAEHAHHVVPLIRGGRDSLGNLVSLCGLCHGAVHGVDMVNHRELTRAGLAAAKARGVKLGGTRPGTLKENAAAKAAAAGRSEALRPILAAMAAQGASLRAMAGALAAAGTVTAKGLPLSASAVSLHLERLELSCLRRQRSR